jgi:uncharacterized protein (DUF2062 family)
MRPVSLSNWARNHLPTRQKLEENRWVRPFAHLVLRADLWRFNRRSVPRGVALGLFTGIFIPFAHSFVAALTAVFVRANVPVAIVATWTSNPFTWALIFPSAFWLSSLMGFHADIATFRAMLGHDTTLAQWAEWLLSSAAPALLSGLFTLAVGMSILGYGVAALVWRSMVAGKRKRRLARHALLAQD